MSDERRKEAEALFMELRNSKLPYGVCKFALGGFIVEICRIWGRGGANNIIILEPHPV